MDVTVRPFAADEWRLWRDLRLRGLGDTPDAFAVTAAEAEARSDDDWRADIARSAAADHEHTLVAHVDGTPAGVGYVGVNEEGVAHVFAMWVAPEFRRLGVGSSLLTWIQAFAGGFGAGSLELWASLAVPGVVDFYRAFCFVESGETEQLRPGSEVEIVPMRLEL